MKIRTRFFSLVLCLCLLCSLLFCSVVNVSALDESITEITTDGWVNYKKLNVLQFTYKTNPSGGYSDVRYTKTVNNLSLPYGPKYYLLDNGLIEEFWITVSLMNVDVDDPTQSDIAVLKPGEAIALNAGLKLWFAGSNSQDSFAPVMADMYECRLYLDDDYTKYITPTLDTSTQNGASLYWSFTNNTDKDIVLSRIAMGVFGDHKEGEGQNIYDSYGYGYALRALKYRIFTDSQMASQAIADSIDQQTEELKDSIDNQTEEHRNMFQRLGDRISGFFTDLTSSIKGFFDDLLTGILDGIKKLFVPEEGYFTEYFAAWDQWMNDHFGALYYPFDLMLDVLNRFLTLEVPEKPVITFPSIHFRIPGQGIVKLTDAVEFNIYTAYTANGVFGGSFGALYRSYQVIVTAIFVFSLANLARKKLNSIMGGGE